MIIKQNAHMYTVNFTWNYSPINIIFLNVEIIPSSRLITSSVHTKTTSHLQYLHLTSCHPDHTTLPPTEELAFALPGIALLYKQPNPHCLHKIKYSENHYSTIQIHNTSVDQTLPLPRQILSFQPGAMNLLKSFTQIHY